MFRRFVLASALAALCLGCDDAGMVPWGTGDGESVECEAFSEAYSDAFTFLQTNAPSFDQINLVTLFGEPGGVDGLNEGVAATGMVWNKSDVTCLNVRARLCKRWCVCACVHTHWQASIQVWRCSSSYHGPRPWIRARGWTMLCRMAC